MRMAHPLRPVLLLQTQEDHGQMATTAGSLCLHSHWDKVDQKLEGKISLILLTELHRAASTLQLLLLLLRTANVLARGL